MTQTKTFDSSITDPVVVALAPTDDGVPLDTYSILPRVRNVVAGDGTNPGSFEIHIQVRVA